MFSNLTINSIFWLFFGVLLILSGAFFALSWKTYSLALGVFLLGTGSSLCGITNGFTDYSPMGRLLWQIGIPTLIAGLLLTIYHLSKYI